MVDRTLYRNRNPSWRDFKFVEKLSDRIPKRLPEGHIMLTFIGLLLAISSALQPQYVVAQTVQPSFPVAEEGTSTVAIIAHYSAVYGVSGADMTRVLTCESGLFEGAVGDHGTSFGIAQIHLPAHPDVSKAQALDKNFSIRWMAEQFSLHRQRMWSCWRS